MLNLIQAIIAKRMDSYNSDLSGEESNRYGYNDYQVVQGLLSRYDSAEHRIK